MIFQGMTVVGGTEMNRILCAGLSTANNVAYCTVYIYHRIRQSEPFDGHGC